MAGQGEITEVHQGRHVADSGPPTSKIGWGSYQSSEVGDGLFKPAPGRRQRLAHVIPDRTKHAVEDETQDIPELEDADDFCSEAPAPPKPVAQRVLTMKELESIMPFMLPVTHEAGIDLRPLMSVLSPPSQVAEADVNWDSRTILAEMEFKFNQDKKQKT